MGKHWRDVKKAIYDECLRIWYDEPDEVKMCRYGIFPSGAGTDKHYLPNLFFLNADTQGMGWWTVEPAMYKILDDDAFSLEICKKTFYYLNNHMAHLMGEICEPACPYPWMNLPTLMRFADDILDSYDSITTKEDFHNLLWTWFTYVNRLNHWFYTIFPWELGHQLKLHSVDYLQELADLQGYKVVKK